VFFVERGLGCVWILGCRDSVCSLIIYKKTYFMRFYLWPFSKDMFGFSAPPTSRIYAERGEPGFCSSAKMNCSWLRSALPTPWSYSVRCRSIRSGSSAAELEQIRTGPKSRGHLLEKGKLPNKLASKQPDDYFAQSWSRTRLARIEIGFMHVNQATSNQLLVAS
jgi:hypothetical protein